MKNGFTLIEILVVMGMIALLATVVLVAINPSRQFKQGRDTQRVSNVNAILNAVGQYIADNKGTLPSTITTTPSDAVGVCAVLMPTYVPSLPVDPSVTTGPVTNCSGAPNTEYSVVKDASGRVTVSAPNAELSSISVTR